MSAKTKWLIAIGVVVVFFAGVASGVFGCAWHMHHMFLEHGSGHLAERMRQHLKIELRLTPAQLEEVTPIIDQTAQGLEAIRDDTSRRVSETMMQSHRDLSPHLTPEQRTRLEELAARHRRVLHAVEFAPPHRTP